LRRGSNLKKLVSTDIISLAKAHLKDNLRVDARHGTNLSKVSRSSSRSIHK
jgi:hypothetical protein